MKRATGGINLKSLIEQSENCLTFVMQRFSMNEILYQMPEIENAV